MTKQKHDIGVQKRDLQTLPMSRNKIKKERLKRGHPGPLPHDVDELDYKELKEALRGDGGR